MTNTASGLADVWGVPAERVPEVWPHVSAWIERALPYCDGKYALEDIDAALLERDMQLWISDRAALVTQLVDYPRQRVCVLMFVGGRDVPSWLWALEMIADWARAQGCQALETWGRQGWARTLPGFEVAATVCRRVL